MGNYEERALDWQRGAEESENRRRLAAEALDRVPPDRRIFPAPQIMGPIFRDNEFELPETPIWEMWSQLLSRACDKKTLLEAHPAFPGIISQLSTQEAKLASLIYHCKTTDQLRYITKTWDESGYAALEVDVHPNWEERLKFFSDFHFGVAHLRQLDLIEVHTIGQNSAPAPEDRVPIQRAEISCEISWWGANFMKAVSKPRAIILR